MSSNFNCSYMARSSLTYIPFLAHLAFRCPVIPTSNQDGHQAKNRKRGDDILKKSSPLKLLSQSQPNFAEMILGWSPSKIVSDISDLRPRWPPQPNLI